MTIESEAREIWRTTPALKLAHADLECFIDAHAVGRAQSVQRHRRALQWGAEAVERSLEVARRRIEAIRAPAQSSGSLHFDRHGHRAVLWAYGRLEDGFEVVDTITANHDAASLTIRIASAGGLVDGAGAIRNAIDRFPGRTLAVIDAYAYSAASFIASAADRVLIRRSATWMAHPSWTTCTGNARALRDTADRLDNDDRLDAALYARKRRIGTDAMRELLESGRYLGADEALAAGVVDGVIHDIPIPTDW